MERQQTASIIIVLVLLAIGIAFFLSGGEESQPAQKMTLEQLQHREVVIDDETVIRESLDYVMSKRITDEEKKEFKEIAVANIAVGNIISFDSHNSTTTTTSSSTTTTLEPNNPPTFDLISHSPDPVLIANTLTIDSTAFDTDGDLLTLYVCRQPDGSSSGCGAGGQWCSDTATTNPTCSFSAPEEVTTEGYYAYIYDQSGAPASNNPIGGFFDIVFLDPDTGWYEDDKGDYAYAEKCDELGDIDDDNCNNVLDKFGTTASFFTTNAWTSLAHYGAYLQDSFQERADEELYWAICDMQLVIDTCEDEPYRCLWVNSHIHVLYEELDSMGNKNIESLNSPLFYGSQSCPHALPTMTQNAANDYEAVIDNVAAVGLGQPRTDDTMVAQFEARGLIAAYEVSGTNSYLTEAQQSIDDAVSTFGPQDTLLYVNGDYEVRENMCWTAVAQLDVYDVTGDSSYLTAVRNFVDSAEVESHMGDTNFIGELAPCLEVLSRLEQLDLGYDEEASSLKTYVYVNNLDSPEYPLYSGEGGFTFTGLASLDATELTEWGNLKTILDTSYMTYTLGRFRKEAV